MSSSNPITWRQTRAALAADHERLRRLIRAQWGPARFSAWMHPGGLCVGLFRIAHFLWDGGHRKSARLVSQLCSLLTGGDLHPACSIGPGLLIPHPCGVALLCQAGRDFTVLSRSGTGMLPKSRDIGAGMGVPLIGDGCVLGPCNGIEGPQRVADGVLLRTGVALMEDAPANARLTAARPGKPGTAPPALAERADDDPCAHRSIGTTWRDFMADVDAYLTQARGRAGPHGLKARLSALLTTQLAALAVHRLSHFAHCRGWRRCAYGLAALIRWFARATLSPASCVGGGWYLPHPAGVVFNGAAGRNLVMFAFTVVASEDNPLRDARRRGPRLGDDVVLAAHSAVLGPVRLGDNVRLGFSAHVHADIPEDRLVVTPGCRPAPAASEVPRLERPVPAPADAEDHKALVRADWTRLVEFERSGGLAARFALWCSPAWLCVRLYRASRRAFLRGALQRARRLWQLNMFLTGADARPWCGVGAGLLIPYPPCVSLGGHAGRGLTLLAMSGVDGAPEEALERSALDNLACIGDEVTLRTHAGVLGALAIGDRVVLAAGARVTAPVEAGATCVHAASRTQRRTRQTGALSMDAVAAQARPHDPAT